jgi:hypothetical protein
MENADRRRGLALLVEKISVNLREKKIRKSISRRWTQIGNADDRREKSA